MLPEAQAYLDKLNELRTNMLKQVEGAPHEALNWKPGVADTNSIYALAIHSTGAEMFWIHKLIGGMPVERDREAEFRASGQDVAELRARFEQVERQTREVLDRLSEQDLAGTREFRGQRRGVRWGILHMVEHYSLHLGHMELTRQLWEAQNVQARDSSLRE